MNPRNPIGTVGPAMPQKRGVIRASVSHDELAELRRSRGLSPYAEPVRYAWRVALEDERERAPMKKRGRNKSGRTISVACTECAAAMQTRRKDGKQVCRRCAHTGKYRGGRFDDAKIEEMRQMKEDGFTLREIGRRFEVSDQYVYKLLSGKVRAAQLPEAA